MTMAGVESDRPSGEEPLIFAWEPARTRLRLARRPLILLLLSIGGHVGSFYGLQVLYTVPATLPPVPAQITVLPPGSAATAAVARWLDVADPALAITAPPAAAGRTAAAAGMPPLRYRPSFAEAAGESAGTLPPAGLTELDAMAAQPRPEPGADALFSAPSAVAAGPPRDVVTPGPEVAPVLPARSAVRLSETLQRRLADPGALPRFEWQPPARAVGGNPRAPGVLLQPAVFLVGLPAGGGSPLVFRQSSSGQTSADESALTFLARLQFAPTAGDEVLWGEATVVWGRDAYR